MTRAEELQLQATRCEAMADAMSPSTTKELMRKVAQDWRILAAEVAAAERKWRAIREVPPL